MTLPLLRSASELFAQRSKVSTGAHWSFEALRGRLIELAIDGNGSALTAAMDIAYQAQLGAEPVAWVSATSTLFYPLDAELFGLDLSALAVVRARNVLSSLRSAERLMRSGAFGVVVLDLGPMPQVPAAALGKLVKLAQLHDAVVICLTVTKHGRTSLGSMVSLRAISKRERVGDGRFICRVEALKDKQRGPGWVVESERSGPAGLR
jgi:recombination protein RecA